MSATEQHDLRLALGPKPAGLNATSGRLVSLELKCGANGP